MTAIVFPGQGSQNIGMARDFYDNFTVVRQIFSNISDSAKIDVKKIIFEDKMKISASIYSNKKRSLKDLIKELDSVKIDMFHVDFNDKKMGYSHNF